MKEQASDTDQYIRSFPPETQKLLNEMRRVIKKAAPEAEECISYGMPAFKAGGKPLVYYAGYKNHIGFYATPSGHKEFEKELSNYKKGKGSVQFPADKPLPLDLIERIVRFRLTENLS
jgi:uncharacterized protein YdhG (YjbR/CyaY superfamily)